MPMTELSYFLVERILHNSVNVMKRQREELGIREYPLFSHRELDEIAHIFRDTATTRKSNGPSCAWPPKTSFSDARIL